jgi:uncharacterized membrane protein YuzA (DUF378 family)
VGINPEWNVVAMIFGSDDAIGSKIVYILVGLSALVALFTHKRDCKTCDTARPVQTM